MGDYAVRGSEEDGKLMCGLSIYSPVLAADSSPTLFSDMSPFVRSNGIRTVANSSGKEPPKDGSPVCMCSRETFGCSTHPTGKEKWIASQAGSLAKILASLGKEKGLEESGQDCGKKWQGSFAKYDQSTHSWRTFQHSLHEALEPLLETWPRWGTVVPGVSLVPLMSVHRTEGNESGLSGSYAHEQDGKIYKKRAAIVLSAMWYPDGKAKIFKWSAGGFHTVYEAEVLFKEVPGQFLDKGSCRQKPIQVESKETKIGCLRAVRLCKELASSSQKQNFIRQHADEFADALRELSQHIALEGSEGEWTLEIEWKAFSLTRLVPRTGEKDGSLWPTLTASPRGPTTSERNAKRLGGVSLESALARWESPTNRTDGPGVHGGLNPNYLEWFMGFPIGYTEKKRSETHKSRSKRLSHGGF